GQWRICTRWRLNKARNRSSSPHCSYSPMPIYEYQCTQCNDRREVIEKFTEPPYEPCTKCGGEVRKLASAPAIQFKGSGFYKTDYASTSPKADSKSEGKSETSSSDSKPSESKSESKTESKTETKSETKTETKPPAKTETKSSE
ncbi:MAG: FmdB family zinc ribbon protein, partial [Thermoanaerobaculia bacterium]